MYGKYIAPAVIAAGILLVGTAHSDERTQRLKITDLFQRAAAEHQLIMTCASNMPNSRKLLESGWKSDIEVALYNVRKNSKINTIALQKHLERASVIDWAMTLKEQQSLCGKETRSSWYYKLIRASTINIVNDTKFILKYD